MSEWITDRRPTLDDAMQQPEPYVKPNRWKVWGREGCYVVGEDIGSTDCMAYGIPTREAAERIAAIYEEVMP